MTTLITAAKETTLSWAFGRGNKLFRVLHGFKATLICCCLKNRPVLSEIPCTYMLGRTTKPLVGQWSIKKARGL